MGAATPQKPTYDELISMLEERDKIIIELTKRIEHLERELAKYQKNSSNSSKPPSSDIVKPKNKKKDKKRKGKKGGQKGHKKHDREEFTPDQIDDFHYYTLDACPVCNGKLTPADEAPRVIQQLDIIEQPVIIEEHRGLAYWCDRCKKIHYAPFPAEIEKCGLTGPGFVALVAFMKGACHASYSTIQTFLKDVLGVSLSRGYLSKLVDKAADALDAPYRELLDSLPGEAVVNVDETGHKENGEKFWTWCFRAGLYALFKIDKHRSSDVLVDVLGEEFNGVLGCDYWGAYKKYMRVFDVLLQFCIAHLIRDIKFLTALPDHQTRLYGKRLLDAVRDMFGVIHRREEMSESDFTVKLDACRERIIRIATRNAPDTKEAANMAARFDKYGDSYFRFITTPGLEPTNNIAEQAIRFVVIDRHVTQGTRSENGRRWSERIWTVIATCSINGVSAFDFIHNAVHSYFVGSDPPSLLPSPA